MTTSELLERITSFDFEMALVASTPKVLRRMLVRCPEIRALQDVYDAGSLSDEEIRWFVDDLLRQGAGCERFPFQTALAAVAVMLEPRFTPLADEYLYDLSRIRSDRFLIAARVARECLNTRAMRIGTEVRQFPQQNPILMTCKWINPSDSCNGYSAYRNADVYDTFEVA